MLRIGNSLPAQECFASGECNDSVFVGEYQAVDSQGCLEQCREDQLCLYFTYYEDEENCLGFADCVNFEEDCESCYSGEVTCDGG